MADLSLTKLKPLLPNENSFSRSDVVRAIMMLWITRDVDHAERIADDLIRMEVAGGIIGKSSVNLNRWRFTGDRCECCGRLP